jgi:hypothetical protein
MKKLFILSALIFIVTTTQAQFLFNRINTVSVVDTNNQLLKNAWAGGLNNPQFSSADLNNDGIEDLVVFNRTNAVNTDRLLTFINTGNGYEYAPEYEVNFPFTEVDSPKIEFWMLMEDYNCDGVKDIYSCTPGYIQLYKGKYDANNKIAFDYVTFLQFNSFSGLLNIFVSSIDIPAVVDVNSDGDLDILTFNIFGFVIEYYENQSIELTGSCGDSIVYELVDDCWADIFEGGLTKAIEVKDTCGTLNGKGGPRHSGSTVTSFDIDADGDVDVLLGDISFNNINSVINGGTADSARAVAQDTIFPSYDVHVEIPVFPASFYLDVTGDGRKDLIVAPNSPKRSENYYCSWFYENTSTTAADTFRLRNRAFLVDEMIDLGEGAYPVFVDINQDSLLDFVVGNYGYYGNGSTYRTGLAYFQNIGTAQLPSFKLITRDLFNLSSLRLNGIAPAFADLDNDGDLDLLLGEENGELYFFTNSAGVGNSINVTLTSSSYFGIDIGQFSTPTFFDVDNDGVLDMVVGERSGNLNFFKNYGTAEVPDFTSTPDNSFFGEVDVRIAGLITGFSTPVFATLDSTNKIYLLSGSEGNGIMVYNFNRDSIFSGSFNKLFEKYSGIREGERTTFAIADLNVDRKQEIIVGNYNGGLGFFSQSDSIAIVGVANNKAAHELKYVVYPNPSSSGQFFIRFKEVRNTEMATISIYNVVGKKVHTQSNSIVSGSTLTIETTQLEKGAYLLEIASANYKKVQKVFIF